MFKQLNYILIVVLSVFTLSCNKAQTKNSRSSTEQKKEISPKYAINFSTAEWKKKLSPEQFQILREEGTEMAFTGKYDHFYQKGTYYSAASLPPFFS